MTAHPSFFTSRFKFAHLLVVLLLGFSLFALQGVAQASPSKPVASLSVPPSGFIGEPISFTVTFDNADTTDPGYAPYIDLILPAAGADGAGAATDDGITFASAAYLGTPLTPVIAPFICAGSFTHPLTGLVTACTPGTQIVVLQLPFGSFTATQPPTNIQVSASLSNLADVNTALTIQARAGFAYGNDPLVNPAIDPPLVQSTPASANFTPTLFKLTKTYLGPEDETATGPNFPRQYRIDVDIANGQTITNLDVTDLLPNNMQFVQLDNTTIRGTVTATTAITTPSTLVPGGTLTRRFASVTGTTASNDATMLFTFYIPLNNTAPARVLDPITGDDVPSPNNASTAGTWAPIDGRDPSGPVSQDAPGPEHILTDKSIAIQKSVKNLTDSTNSPGDVLEYTLDFQISDFFAFQNLIIDDTFSDGQHWDAGFTPTMQVDGNPFTLTTAALNAANYTVTPNYTPAAPAPNDGTTAVQFRVSDELIGRGENGQLLGGCVKPSGSLTTPCNIVSGSGDGPTTARIVFRTIIQDEFTDNYPSGDKSVDEGDLLHNDVTIAGAVLDNDTVLGDGTLAPTGQPEADVSSASVEIGRGSLAKTIYAVNGVVCSPQPCTNVAIEAGDTVTYRLRRDLPSSDIEQLRLIDYLPLPIFDVDDNSAPVVSRITAFSTTVSAAPPAPGTAQFGPADTFYALSGINPFNAATANDSIANSVTFDYGSYDNPANPASKIDILLTVTANSMPFGDGLFLTNQLHEVEASTNNTDAVRDAIVQITMLEPVLNIRKGVVATDKATATFAPVPNAPVAFNAPGTLGARFAGTINSTNLATTPIDSNLSGVDAGDLVTFAIVVQNTGTAPNGEFDAKIRDSLPAGFVIPTGGAGLNLHIADGTGAAMSFTDLGGGLFGTGIALDDPGPTATPIGALDPGKNPDGSIVTSGRNIAIITYDLQVDTTVAPNQTIVNTATLFNYSSLEGGVDHTISDLTDLAAVTTGYPSGVKSIVATSEAHTSESGAGTNANPRLLALGEIVRYRLLVDIPEGQLANLQLTDRLPSGLTFLNDNTAKIALVSNGGGITSSSIAGAGLAQTGNATNLGSITPTFTIPGAAIGGGPFGDGTDPTFSLGDLTNSDNDTDVEYVVVEFNALVDNSAAGSNDAGDTRDNNFTVSFTGAPVITSNTVRATIVEPSITNLNKVVVNPASAQGDAGDTVTYRVTYSNATGATVADAFDIHLVDALPIADLVLNPASVTVTLGGGASGITDNTAGNTVDITIASVPKGGIVQIDYQATLKTSVTPGQQVNNTANLTYTSLPGANGSTSNPTGSSTPGAPGSSTGERDGSGGAINDYNATKSAAVTVFVPAPVKSLVSTSEASTSGANLAVGEIARYRLLVRVAEGSSPDMQLHDSLPAGLLFLNDGTATVALVSDDPGLSSSTLDAAAQVQGNETTINSITPTFALPASAIIGGTGAGGAFQNGDDPIFMLGDLTNTDSDANQELAVVEFNALALNVGINLAGTNRDNTFDVLINNNPVGTPSNTVTTTIVEPSITNLNKTVFNPATGHGDAGDTITYRVTYSNANGANNSSAFEARILDTLPSYLTLNVASVTVTLGNGSVGITNNSAGNTIDITIASVPKGGSVQIDYQATLTSAVAPNQLVTNTAQLTYTSLPGAAGTADNPTGSDTPGASGSSTGERDGSGGINNYAGSDPAAVTIDNVVPLKQLATTSESSTSASKLAIGEIGRYRLQVQLPEGTTANTSLIDSLPAGMRFLNDGTAKVAFVADGPGISSSTLSGAGLSITGNDTTISGIAPNFVLPAGAISGGTGAGGAFQSGDDPVFALGTLVNNDSDTNYEYVVVEFNAVLENIASNTVNATRSNTFAVRSGATTLQTSNSVSITVAEPSIGTPTKTVTSAPTDAGDTVVYTLNFSAATGANRSTAFDVRLQDALSSYLTLPAPASNVSVTAPAYATVTNNSTSSAVDVTLSELRPGDSVTVQVSARVVASAPNGQIIPNFASLTYTSLPGLAGTAGNPTGSAAGASGSATGERSGTGGVNSYSRTSSTVNVTLATPTIDKLNPTPASAPIGEDIAYDIKVTLPEGVTKGLVVTDALPNGLAYQSYTIITTAGGNLANAYAGDVGSLVITANPATTPGADGQDLILSFPDITTTSDNDTSNNTFLVHAVARVSNTLANQGYAAATTLANTASLTYTNPNTGTSSAPVTDATAPGLVTVIEPRIATTKQVSPTSGVQGGDLLTYTVRFTNTGNSTAYDVTADDTLPPSTTFTALTGCVDQTSTPVAATISGTTIIHFDGSPAGGWDIPAGGYIQCVYSATTNAAITLRNSYTNSVDADWTSLDGAGHGERVYDDTTAYTVDGTQDTANATFTTPGVTFAKTDNGATNATIGDWITYTLTITGYNGTINDLVIDDTLPAGLIFDTSFTPVLSGISAKTASVSAPNDGSAAINLSWDWSTGSDAVITSSPATITYRAIVANVAANQDGVTRTNSAVLNYKDGTGTAQPPQTGSDGVTITEPRIATSKQVNPTSGVLAGDVLTYTVTMVNTGTSTAYDIVLDDVLPAGVGSPTLLDCQLNGAAVVSSLNGAAPNITIQGSPAGLWDLPVGQQIVCRYTVVAQPSLVAGSSFTNTADADWSSQDGASNPNERVYDDTTSYTVDGTQDTASATFSTPSITFAKSDNGAADVTIGDSITYTLTINGYNGTVNDLVIKDTLPAGLIFDASFTPVLSGISANTVTVSAPNDGSAAVNLSWDWSSGADAVLSNPATITYRAIVANVASNQDGVARTNSATLDYKDRTGTAQPQQSGSDDVAVAEPTLQLSKAVSPISADVGDLVTYTITVTNTSATTAYDAVIGDSVPAGLAYEPGTISISANPTGATAIMTDTGAPSLQWQFPQIGPGQTVVVGFQARVTDKVLLNAGIINQADATWSSQPGNSPVERTGADGPSGSPDDYATNGQITLQPASYIVSKTLLTPPNGLAGVNDTNITFRIMVTNTATVPLATIPLSDTFDTTYLQYLSATSTPDLTAPVGTLAWNDITGPGTLAPNGVITIDVTFKAVTHTTTVLPPSATTTNHVQISGAQDTNGRTLQPRGAATDVAIGLPDLTVTKDDGQSIALPGQIIKYTLIVTNTGSYPASGVVLTETPPANTTYNAANSSVAWTPAAGTYTYQLLAPLGPGTSQTVIFAVQVDNPLPSGPTSIDNLVTVSDDGAHGPDLTPANNSSHDIDTLVPATFGDRIWYDSNGDGVQNPSEIGIGGATVKLTWYGPDNTFGGGDDASYTTTTDANGEYLFTGLPAGAFQVDVDTASLPFGLQATYDLDGGNDSTTLASLAIGQHRSDADFGYRNPEPPFGSIGDRVWQDANADGMQDPGEQGIANVTVKLIEVGPDGLFGTADDVVNSTTTDTNGNYLFEFLPAGSYRVQIDTSSPALAGMAATYELDGTLNGTTMAGLAAEQNRTDVDFGFRPSTSPSADARGSIGDRIWNDADADGLQDSGEPGLAGVSIALTWYGPNGILGGGDDVSTTTTTDSSGAYLFTNLPAGAYTVAVDQLTLPAGMRQTYELDGTPDNTALIALAQGQDRDDVDFGYTSNAGYTPPTGALGDRVWFDRDRNGKQDPGEPGIAGVPVTLTWYGADGAPGGGDDIVYTQLTDASGNYYFTQIPAGNYGVAIDPHTLPAGLTETYDLDGSNDNATAATLAAGEARTDVDFGYAGTGAIGDRIWNDANADRVQDPAETGIGGVDVTLVWFGPNGQPGGGDDLVYTTTTDPHGYYHFDTLPAGSYHLTVDSADLPAGMHETYELDGTLNGGVGVALAAGEQRYDLDFGYTSDPKYTLPAGAIGDRIWFDANANGVQDRGEPGLPGVTVNLVGPGGVIYMQATDAQGNYNFTNLPAGTYQVLVDAATLPGGMHQSGDPDASLDAQTSIALGAGQVVTTADFGYTGAGSISRTVWIDTDRDGVIDPSEQRIANVALTLTWYGPDGQPGGGDDMNFTATTDANGDYTFANLPAGGYTVQINTQTLPAGLIPVYDRDGNNDSVSTVVLGVGQQIGDVNFGYITKPTVVTLESFTATMSGTSVDVRWVTGAELNTWGFYLYRSSDGQRAHAQQITPNLILAQGRGQAGASYSWQDTQIDPGTPYTYWLVEVELNGTQNEYGPATATPQTTEATHQVYLPIIIR